MIEQPPPPPKRIIHEPGPGRLYRIALVIGLVIVAATTWREVTT